MKLFIFTIFLSSVAFTFTLSIDINDLKEKCYQGNGKVCAELSSYYRGGYEHLNIEKNITLSKVYYKKYYELANTKDLKALDKQCQYGLSESCRYIAVMYKDGTTVKKNRQKEIEYYKKACALGSIFSCEKIPISNDMPEYFQAAVSINGDKKYTMLDKACSGGYAKACAYLYQLYKKDGETTKSKKLLKKTKLSMEQSCSKDHGKSCEWLGIYYLKNKEMNTAKKYLNKTKKLYKQECDLKGLSCFDYELLKRNFN